MFDIRVMFINSGPCGLPQNTGYLHFCKGEVTARNNVYTCSIRDSRCPETSKNSAIRAVWAGGHRLNLNLTKAYATVDDQALYTVLLELDYRGENMNKKTICNEHLSPVLTNELLELWHCGRSVCGYVIYHLLHC